MNALKVAADFIASLPRDRLSLFEHPKEKLAFYSRRTVDIMFRYPFGVQELWGIAARSDYDLKQHAKFSGKPLELFDEASKTKVIPHVIEPAVGVDRILLAVLVSPWFMALAAVVGAGLTVAGVTGFCGMANLLRHMPWNRSRATAATPLAGAQ